MKYILIFFVFVAAIYNAIVILFSQSYFNLWIAGVIGGMVLATSIIKSSGGNNDDRRN